VRVNVLRDVPILRTGIEYQLGSGPHTFTPEDLRSAVEAINDPHVRTPRLGLGHVDERFQPAADADPAFGAVQNLRLAHSGNVVIADLEVGPEWLTEDVVASAFPGRSIEATTNWTTPGGQRWPLVITAVKLLGTRWPGISTLDDLRSALTTGPSLVYASWREEDPNEGGPMTPLIERLRALPADADDAAVMAVIREHASSETPPAPDPQPDPEPEPQPEPEPAPPQAEVPVPVAAGTSVIDNATLEELRRNAELGREAHERQQREDRDRLLASAVTEGRFPPSRSEHYQRLYDADPEGTQQLVASLAPGLVPVDERGGAPAPEATPDLSNEPFDWSLPAELRQGGNS
jgi:hypothetical protein